jgi:glycosyltransferase involved in cell wall biosynthesis
MTEPVLAPDARPVGRILLITGFWPTADQPSAGIFVARRAAGQPMTVVAPRSYRGWMPVRYILLAARALIARGPFAGVEAHPLFPAGLIGLLTARIRRIPLVVYAHGSDVRSTATRSRVHLFLAGLVVRGAATIVTNSRDTATHIERLGRSATVIPPGVDRELFHPSPRPRTGRVLYLGGSDPGKGHDVAVALADTLLGPGINSVSGVAVAAAIAEHDIVLVPSRAEGFGLVAAEAIASGRWVVARNVGGLAEVVAHGVTGTLVDDDAGFAEAIRTVPDYDPDRVAELGTALTIEASNAEMTRLWKRIQAQEGRDDDLDPATGPASNV